MSWMHGFTPFPKVKENDETWTTKDNRVMKISEMSNHHIKKVVELLEKYNRPIPRLMQERMKTMPEKNPELFL